jgi:hypothetical protein
MRAMDAIGGKRKERRRRIEKRALLGEEDDDVLVIRLVEGLLVPLRHPVEILLIDNPDVLVRRKRAFRCRKKMRTQRRVQVIVKPQLLRLLTMDL